jgi:hypothetical protein
MASRLDTVHLVRADLTEARDFLSKAEDRLRGRGIFVPRSEESAQNTIRILERATQRLRRSFRLDN